MIYSGLTYLSYVREEKERMQVRGAFGRYMSPALVEQLAENPDRLQLGGEMRVMTLLFCDVRGFTKISELYKSDPQGLTSLINRFLTPTTDDILARRGTIDKYMGDCIMAFWNAPLDDEDHIANACSSALAMMISVEELNVVLKAEAEEQDKPFIQIKVGIGLNTGECCVGNMGSEQRFDYSVLGDPVNLGSRLEGANKAYGTRAMISQRTRDLADDDIAVRELDLIRVKGKHEPTRVYELLPVRVDQAALPAAELEYFPAGLNAYRRQAWGDAETAFKACLESNPDNSAAAVYLDRIAQLRANPPGADWDGVWVFETK